MIPVLFAPAAEVEIPFDLATATQALRVELALIDDDIAGLREGVALPDTPAHNREQLARRWVEQRRKLAGFFDPAMLMRERKRRET